MVENQSKFPISRQIDLPFINRIYQQWAVGSLFTDEQKTDFLTNIGGLKVLCTDKFLNLFVQLIGDYTEILGVFDRAEGDAMSSSLAFFYGCFTYILRFPNFQRQIEQIFYFDLLYLLVDHYLDDIRTTVEEKKEAIREIRKILTYPEKIPVQYSVEDSSNLINLIAQVYHRMWMHSPLIKRPILALFEAEIDGLKIQHNASLDEEAYLQIAERKGGYTMECLPAICGITRPEEYRIAYRLGGLLQVIDDCIDVDDDQTKGFSTIATHVLQTTGNLDPLLQWMLREVEAIDPKNTLFKVITATSIAYIPQRKPAYYSESCLAVSNRYNLIVTGNAAQTLNDAVLKEIRKLHLLGRDLYASIQLNTTF